MAFGLVCIGSDLGLIRTFLSGGRGLLVQPGNVEELAEALRKVASAPEEYEAMRRSAAGWAQGYSLESMREGLRKLMMESWQLSDSHFPARSEAAETR
jgi:glycosyltransferase involved in cell wall biosynthesis